MGDTGSELDFTDEDVGNEEGALFGSQDRSVATDFSSMSSGRSLRGRPKSAVAAHNDDGAAGGAKRSSALLLMMGRTKRQRTKERLESSQSSTGGDSGSGAIICSSQESSSSSKNKKGAAAPAMASSSSSSSRRRAMKSRRTKPLSMKLAKISEHETISSTGVTGGIHHQRSASMMSFRSDHFSVKDLAHSQMLLDESLFLCESIVSQRNPLEPLESLTEMLSNRESRRHLFLSSSSAASQGSSQALQGVVNVFAWVNRFVQNIEGDGSGGKLSASQSSCESTMSSLNDHGDLPDRRPILNAAKLVAYFISLDCTLCPEACHTTKNNHGSAAAARRIRHTILSNPDCMQGLFQLVLDDPLTERLRDEASQGNKGKNSLSNDSGNGTPGSVSVGSNMDPTLQGRLKRRQLKLERESSCSRETTPEAKSEASLSFASSSAPVAKKSLPFHTNGRKNDVLSQKGSEEAEAMDKAGLDASAAPDGALWRSISHDLTEHSFQHTCGDDSQSSYITSSVAPLYAIKRIISAKHEGYEESAIDDDQGIDKGDGDPDNGDDDYNPIVASNQMLSSSGALPLLSRALANSLAAAIAQVRRRGRGCEGCVKSLSGRICSLAFIADAASLFNVGNRKELCNEGFTSETNGYLVVAMISFLRSLLGDSMVLLDGAWGETALSLLKTLTSLSHENDVVANELKSKLSEEAAATNACASTGLGVLVAFLRECVAQIEGKNDRESKLLYDCQIYCLSIMTNIASSRGCIGVLSALTVPHSEGTEDVLFVQWLTRWLVSLTKSFHAAILESSFGSTSSKHKDRILTLREEEGLVASGKGFIFLSRIIIVQSQGGRGTETIRSILEEIPGNTSDDKMKMIRNTLKAFMSFYQQSVGGLSVAITAPLQILLKKLDTFEVPVL